MVPTISQLKGVLQMKLSRINPWLRLAWLLPDRLVYWCGIRMASYATDEEEPDKVSVMDMLGAWEEGHEI